MEFIYFHQQVAVFNVDIFSIHSMSKQYPNNPILEIVVYSVYCIEGLINILRFYYPHSANPARVKSVSS